MVAKATPFDESPYETISRAHVTDRRWSDAEPYHHTFEEKRQKLNRQDMALFNKLTSQVLMPALHPSASDASLRSIEVGGEDVLKTTCLEIIDTINRI